MPEQVDPTELRQKFVTAELGGVVALIDYIEEEAAAGLHLTEIGSSSIDFDGIMKDLDLNNPDDFLVAWLGLKRLYIGGNGVTPLQWLDMAQKILYRLTPEARQRFDHLCANFAHIGKLARNAKPLDLLEP